MPLNPRLITTKQIIEAGGLVIRGSFPFLFLEGIETAGMTARLYEIAGDFWFTVNARFENSAWLKDDTSKASIAHVISASGDSKYKHSPAGSSAISWTDKFILSSTGQFTAGASVFASNVIASTIGPSAAQQHTLPAVASDTFVLVNAPQTLVNKTFSGTLLPATDNSTDFGSPTLRWKTGYFGTSLVSPTVGPSAAQQHTLPAVGSDTFVLVNAPQTLVNKTFSGTLLPATDNSTDFGSPTLRWRTGYFGSSVVVSQGTIAQDKPAIDISATWDDAGVGEAFTGVKLAVTDVSSSIGSRLLSLLVGGSSKFDVYKDGFVRGTELQFDKGLFGFDPGGTEALRTNALKATLAIFQIVRPLTDDLDSLGNASFRWKDLYISGAVRIGPTNNTLTSPVSDSIAIGTAGVERVRVISAGSGLQLQGDPTANLQAATKQYVDSAIGGLSAVKANPLGADVSTISGTDVSTGFGVTIVPGKTGRILALSSFVWSNSGLGVVGVVSIYRSTVGIPAAGSSPNPGDVRVSVDGQHFFTQQNVPFLNTLQATSFGLTVGTTYYFYLVFRSNGSSTVTIKAGADFSAIEE